MNKKKRSLPNSVVLHIVKTVPGLGTKVLAVSMLVFIINVFGLSQVNAQDFDGVLDAKIACPGGDIRFGLELKRAGEKWSGFLINGPERIEIPSVKIDGQLLELDIDHYDSRLDLRLEHGKRPGLERFIGTWKKRQGKNKWVEMKFSADRKPEPVVEESNEKFLGRWEVNFKSEDDVAVGVFEAVPDSNRVLGTFLTTTGDYRFLDGYVSGGKLRLSCFDGAHAFLFHATVNKAGNLEGDFWSSNTWHDTWTAKPNPNASLPDSFKQTVLTRNLDLGSLSFPDLDGNLTKLNDPRFAGKARIIYVFGSWCPNCHDAGEYFSTLEKKYGPQGLSILGLAFELTGEHERDAAQVQKYLERHGSTYPCLVAGLSSKAAASKALPILDRVRSYPTTLFLDGKGNVTAVHTGFTGPATGEEFETLKQKFESLIEASLKTSGS